MTGLTADDLKVLTKPFRKVEHEFTRGFVYISEEAITARLDEVDPSWTFEIQRIELRGRQAVAVGRLTVKGVMRENTGMQSVEYLKDKVTKEETEIEAGEPEKGATTDALKRCARLFGIGRYLLSAPREGNDFDRWLAERQSEWMKSTGLTLAPPTPATNITPITPAANPPQPLTSSAADAQTASGESREKVGFDDIVPAQYGQVREVVKAAGKNGKTYYRLVCEEDFTLTTFSDTVIEGLGLNPAEMEVGKKAFLKNIVKVPFVINGEYRNVDDKRAKVELGVAS